MGWSVSATQPGVHRLADLVNKGGGVFDRVWSWPTLLTLADHVIGWAFKLSSLNGHEPIPLSQQQRRSSKLKLPLGTQRLHRDWGGQGEIGPSGSPLDETSHRRFYVLNSIWCLDDWTKETGATRLVPGSHRWPAAAADASPSSRGNSSSGSIAGQPLYLRQDSVHSDTHPDQRQVEAPAGSVIVFNAHTLHAGCPNRSWKQRR